MFCFLLGGLTLVAAEPNLAGVNPTLVISAEPNLAGYTWDLTQPSLVLGVPNAAPSVLVNHHFHTAEHGPARVTEPVLLPDSPPPL